MKQIVKSDVVESLKIIFGSMENIRDQKFYAYVSEHKNEREIPPYMVAVAATAVSFIIYIILPFVLLIIYIV